MTSDVEHIKERLSITDVVSPYVKLKQAGASLKGLSPFTNEKTPSFFVSPDRGLYHCFSSGKGGDMFTFIQEVEGVDFSGALRILAEQAGIELSGSRGKGPSADEREHLYTLLEDVTDFYQKYLVDSQEAQNYLKGRGINKESIKKFRIGYAPSDWRTLHTHLSKRGYSDDEQLKVGVLKRKDSSLYDTFRDRLIFPIQDVTGRVIAFSGRVLNPNDSVPKYLNSPDTLFFKKSKILYGYFHAKRALARNDFCILVEGQFDLVLSHQVGFPTAVAVSGSSFTADHLSLVKRHTHNVIIAFDSDESGIRSARKAGTIALRLGMNVKSLNIPAGKDPADVITHDANEWKEMIRSAVHLIDQELHRVVEDESDQHKRLVLVRRHILPLIVAIPQAMDRSYFVAQIARTLEIPESSIQKEIDSLVEAGYGVPGRSQVSDTKDIPNKTEPEYSWIERALLEITALLKYDKLHEKHLDVGMVKKRLEEWDLKLPEVEESILSPVLFNVEERSPSARELDKELEILLLNVSEYILKKRREELTQAINKATKAKDEVQEEKYLSEYQEITKRLEELKELEKRTDL